MEPKSQLKSVQAFQVSGRRVIWHLYRHVDSTMQLSSKFINDARSSPKQCGLERGQVGLFTAEYQTNGVGKGNRKWQSPQGNIYMTLVLKVPTAIVGFLPIYTSIVIKNTLQQYTQKPISCRWVNDLLVNNSKFCGFLVRADVQGEQAYAEIGIGIDIEVACLEEATCLSAVSHVPIPPIHQLIKTVVTNYVAGINQIGNPSIRQAMGKQYTSLQPYINRHVYLYDDRSQLLKEGVFQAVTSQGYAVVDGVQYPRGTMRDMPFARLLE